MNNLGGMVFIVAGIALGYWALTGKAVNFLHAVNFGGQAQPQQPYSFWKSLLGPLSGFVNYQGQGTYGLTQPVSQAQTDVLGQTVPYLTQDLQNQYVPGVNIPLSSVPANWISL